MYSSNSVNNAALLIASLCSVALKCIIPYFPLTFINLFYLFYLSTQFISIKEVLKEWTILSFFEWDLHRTYLRLETLCMALQVESIHSVLSSCVSFPYNKSTLRIYLVQPRERRETEFQKESHLPNLRLRIYFCSIYTFRDNISC